MIASASILLLVAVGFNQLMFVSAQGAADTKEPTDIETLTATAGDGEIKLTWSAASDDTAVTGYKIYEGDKPVGDDGDVYNLPNIETENTTEYIVKGLKNDQPYYFSVTALDAAGNESINYSPEATATPKAGAPKSDAAAAETHGASVEDNGQAPKVLAVSADSNVTVKVQFSEAIKLPSDQPASAFNIVTSATKERLAVQTATLDSSDATGATVLLTTAPQKENTDYVVTVGIEVKDFNNNPIVSGTSDTGSFKGMKPDNLVAANGASDSTPVVAVTSDVSTDLKVISGSADYNDRMQLVFSGPIQLPTNTLTALTVTQKGTDKKLNILNVSLSVDGTTIYVITEKQSAVDYEITFGDIRDAKNKVLAADTKFVVTGKGVADTTPPEDVTDFVAKVKNVQQSIIGLQWKPSINSANDLADYTVYQSEGKNTSTFGEASALGANTTSVEIQNLNPGKWYTFKMTAKDTTGNESKGILANVYLPETGPGAIAAGLTGLVMGWYKRRKNRK